MAKPGPTPAVPPEDVLDVFRNRADASEPLTAPEIAEALDCSRRTALNRLHELADSGLVATKKVGGRSRVWWIPADEANSESPASDDPLFMGGAVFASEDPVDESAIDDILYGSNEG